MILTDPNNLRPRLANARTIAVLGAHTDLTRPARYVPEYLHHQGCRILPVNPTLVGQTLWGEPVRASLLEWKGQFDLVDVFRRSEALPDHVEELLGACRPGTLVWFQLGIRNDTVATELAKAGLDVVQNRCILADHRAWGLGRVP